jgi:kynurenine formamidase
MQKYRNADAQGITHYPGYADEAVQLLVEDRGVFGIGIDTMGVDYGPSRQHPNHRYTGAHNIFHVENLANLEMLPPRGATLVVAPMKLEGGSGAPARVFALIS